MRKLCLYCAYVTRKLVMHSCMCCLEVTIFVSYFLSGGRVKPTVDELLDPSGRFVKKAVNVRQ